MAIAASVGVAVFQRSLQPAAANHSACGQLRQAHATGDCAVSFSFSDTIGATSMGTFPALAARTELRLLACGAHVLSMIRFTSWGLSRVPANSGSGRWPQADADLGRELRHQACPSGHRDDWRLDFRALSGKTPRTVARDGRE